MPNKDRLYAVYSAMKQRCYSPKNPSYKFYSRRNITVCQEWLDSFQTFKDWALLNGYDYSKNRKEQSLDRIDNSKGYSPDNCRFVTHSENCKNTIRNIWIEYNGERKVLNDWSKQLGIPIETLRRRYLKGESAEMILFGEKFHSHKSNTGIKGISFRNKTVPQYVVHINHKYIGCKRTLEEAIELKENYIKCQSN